MAVDYYSFLVKLRALVLIDDELIELPVTAFSANWDLNTVPDCTLRLAVGKNVETEAAATSHAVLSRITNSTRIRVQLQLSPSLETHGSLKGASVLGIPKDYPEFTIFRGYVATVSFARSRESANAEVVLVCRHTLIKLGSSSSLSYESHPLNPSQYTYGALLPGSQTGGRDWTGITSAQPFVTPARITTDFWGQCIRPIFEKLLDGNTLRIAELGLTGTAKNRGGQAALDNIQTRSTPAAPNNQYKALGLGVDIDATVANRIAEDLALNVLSPENLAHQTLWDVLISLSQQYLFAVVPRVTDSLVVPYVPTLKQSYIRIQSKEYTSIARSLSIARPIQAVGILSDAVSQTGSELRPGGASNVKKLGLGGWFQNGTEGSILIQQSPRWMTGLVSPSLASKETAGGGGRVKSSTFQPAAGARNSITTTDAVDARAASQIKPLLNRYAEAIYEIEALKGRQMTLSGPLRFDIAPGSSIQIEGTPSAGLLVDETAPPVYSATVFRVSINIFCDPPTATTTIQLSHVRSSTENDNPAFASPNHPLWNKETFVGCPLVNFEELGFDTQA